MPRKQRSISDDNARREPLPIICKHCEQPIVRGQEVGPLFAPKIVKWHAHPVLSKPATIRGEVRCDGGPSRRDLSLHEQLQQRAAMGGERERAELAAFEKLWRETITQMLVAEMRKTPPSEY